MAATPTFDPPETFNLSEHLLAARLEEDRGGRTALVTDAGTWSYEKVHALACRFGHALRDAGVRPEERVLVALPDGPRFVAALFGTLRIGAVAVMVNPDQKPDGLAHVFGYTRARAALVGVGHLEAFQEAARDAVRVPRFLVVGEPSFDDAVDDAPPELDPFPSHRDDAAIWLFSGGTTGRPKAVVQSHASFGNTTELYGVGVLGMGEDDRVLAVPKLYFGYATGSALFFPFRVGAASVLFPGRCTVDALFGQIERHRPTVLVNVPTMINHMVGHPDAASKDLSSLRLATSAGEALPVELHRRWDEAWGVELLDGLGTAEMWHVFLSNRPGDVGPGTLGRPVPGFEVRLRDDEGHDVPRGEPGTLWVKGRSRAWGYWQNMEKTAEAFRGPWYVSGDMLRQDGEGRYVYCGRADDMLKVSGKWMAPAQLENCLLEHPRVREVAVVGVVDDAGLTKPHAFVVAEGGGSGALEQELQAFARERIEPHAYPRAVIFLASLPRTHLGKVDRGALGRGDTDG